MLDDREFELQSENVSVTTILQEASNWDLYDEVVTSAEQYIQDDPTIEEIEAYQKALNEWVK